MLFLAALLVGSAASAQEPTERSETEELTEVSDTKQLCAKFENHAHRFVCIFYRPEDEWLVNTVHWDDQATLLF